MKLRARDMRSVDMEERVRNIPVHHLISEPENAFQQCAACGQAFDTRSREQTIHHSEPGHRPLTDAELREFATARDQGR